MRRGWWTLWVLFCASCALSHGRGDPSGAPVPAESRDGGAASDAFVSAPEPPDASAPTDAAILDNCAPYDVRVNPCVEGDCIGEVRPSGYFWDGDRCAPFPWCTACLGEDCGRLLPTLEACRTAHSGCPSSLCEATGGLYLVERSPDAVPCDCGLGGLFVEGEGCREAGYGAQDLCLATGGQWHPPGTAVTLCGGVNPAGFTDDRRYESEPCECGGGLTFDLGRGCVVPDAEVCPTPSPEQLCERSGGSWGPGCAGACGTSLDCDCEDCWTCTCGRFEVFGSLGCVRSPECSGRLFRGEYCDSASSGGLECEPLDVCCDSDLGGGRQVCRAPVCSEFGPCGP
jgi:hypothetical protein